MMQPGRAVQLYVAGMAALVIGFPAQGRAAACPSDHTWAYRTVVYYIDRASFEAQFPQVPFEQIEAQIYLGVREWWARGQSPVEPRYGGNFSCANNWGEGVCIFAPYWWSGGPGWGYTPIPDQATILPAPLGDFGTGGWTHASIWFNQAPDNTDWVIDSTCKSAGRWKASFREVVTHEFGHVLGLSHCDGASQDDVVMRAFDYNAYHATCPVSQSASRTQRYPKWDDIAGLNSRYPLQTDRVQEYRATGSPPTTWTFIGDLLINSVGQVAMYSTPGGTNAWAYPHAISPYQSELRTIEGSYGAVNNATDLYHDISHGSPAVAYKFNQFNVAWTWTGGPRTIAAKRTTTWPNTWSGITDTTSIRVDDGHVELVYDPISGKYVFLYRNHQTDTLHTAISNDGLNAAQLFATTNQNINVIYGAKMDCGVNTDANGYNCILVYAKSDAYSCLAWSKGKAVHVYGDVWGFQLDGVHDYCYTTWSAPDVVLNTAYSRFELVFNAENVTWMASMRIGDTGWSNWVGVWTYGAREPSLGQSGSYYYMYY